MDGVRARGGVVLAAAAVLLGGACGGDGAGDGAGDGGATTTRAPGRPGAAATTTSTTGALAELEILVTNDDGVGAEGIATLVAALAAVEGVDVTVVAPAEQRSGTGGSTTPGPLTTRRARTAGGYEATAVDGFPADTIRVALDDVGLDPDVVIAGINEGQNVGPLVEVSGTVGAARAAAREGIPALAVSQALGDPLDYEVAAELVVDWLAEHRDALAAGRFAADSVLNLNVPSCERGAVRGVLDVGLAAVLDALPPTSDCRSRREGFTDDAPALDHGFATMTAVSVEPATPSA